MKYILEIPDNLAEMDYEEQRIAVLKAWEENRYPAVEIRDPLNFITGKTHSIPYTMFAIPGGLDEKSEG